MVNGPYCPLPLGMCGCRADKHGPHDKPAAFHTRVQFVERIGRHVRHVKAVGQQARGYAHHRIVEGLVDRLKHCHLPEMLAAKPRA